MSAQSQNSNLFSSRPLTEWIWAAVIAILVLGITYLHYSTDTMKWQYHLIYMESYFIPILIGALQFGLRGGVGVALVVTIFYFPHVMLQWGGLVEGNLMRFMQMILFNVVGAFTGWKAQREKEETLKYQQAVKELENSLQKIREQSLQISELEEQLRHTDRLAVVGEMTASLAHEVRNPLGAIRGAVEILRDELNPKAEHRDFLKILIQETERLNRVVENYLSFAGRRERKKQPFDPVRMIQNILLLAGPGARKKGIRLITDWPTDSFKISGNPVEFQQVVLNLVLNAIQALEDGGEVRIAVHPSPDEKEKKIRISISDNGPGIPPEIESKIFEIFFTTRSNGSGLGLAITKRIADTNGWKIHLHNQPGKGCEFLVEIPLYEGI